MIKVIDSNVEIKKAKNRYAMHIVLIVLLLIAYTTGSLLLLLTSNLKYTLPMVADIVISAVVVSFLIFYFINVFPIVRHYYKFYTSLKNNTFLKKKIMIFEKEDEPKTRDGVVYRRLVFSTKEQQQVFYNHIYVLDNEKLKFEAGQMVRLGTFQNVLLEYEVLENANAQ